MKKILAVLAVILSATCFYTFSYGEEKEDDIVIKLGNELTLTPYKNFRNEGQISSEKAVIENLKDIPQPIYIELIDTEGSDIELRDVSVISNDFGEEKVAFVHLLNVNTGEKTLIYNIGEKIEVGTAEPGETAVYKICGELNMGANWELGGRLALNINVQVGEEEAESEESSEDTEDVSFIESEESSESVSYEDNAGESDGDSKNSADNSEESGAPEGDVTTEQDISGGEDDAEASSDVLNEEETPKEDEDRTEETADSDGEENPAEESDENLNADAEEVSDEEANDESADSSGDSEDLGTNDSDGSDDMVSDEADMTDSEEIGD